MKRIICLVLTFAMLFSLVTVTAEGEATSNGCTFYVSDTESKTVKSGEISAKFSITNSAEAAEEYVAFTALYVSGVLTDIAMSAATVEAGAAAEIKTGTVNVTDPTVSLVKAFIVYRIDGDNHKMDTFEMSAYVEEAVIEEGFAEVPVFDETAYYRIYNKWSKDYIYDDGGETISYGEYEAKNRDKFLWQIAKDGDVYRIRNKYTQKFVTTSADGLKVNTREVDASVPLSNWTLQSKDGKYIMFKNVRSNKYLNTESGAGYVQCNVNEKSRSKTETWASQWYLEDSGKTPVDNSKEFADYDTKGLENNKIYTLTPAYCANVNGDTVIKVAAPGVKSIVAKCWQGGDDEWGHDALVATAKCDENGFAMFTFPAEEFPHGPAIVRISDMFGSDTCHLQLYNTGGYSWEEGLEEATVPPIVIEKGLNELFADDFDNPNLGIADSANINAKYYSHKKGGGDFSGIPFTSFDTSKCPFSQVDTYMRIRADQRINSSGIVSSIFNDMSGFAVKVPAYFECKFVAQNAKGSWPAFWTLSTNAEGNNPNGTDELDIIEAYGFDSTQSANVTGYTATSHTWSYTSPIRESIDVDHYILDQSKVHSGGMWYTNFHTYGLYIDEEWTIYYHDNEEIWRHPTFERTKEDYTWFLINYAFGGSSGWPWDLSRYDHRSDMYVDWVRVYGLEENLLNKPKGK